MRKILTYSSFLIASLFVMGAFMTATSYFQLAIAVALYPLLVYFAFKAFPGKTQNCSKKLATTETQPPVLEEKVDPVKQENKLGIADIDKRVFLKLIGGAGITLFLFSIFNKKAEGLFFKSVPTAGVSGNVSLQDSAGQKIDPAQNQPTDGYKISEIDDGAVMFYGFINQQGAWYVMKEDSETGSFRYAKGDSNFPGNWTNRENLKYDYYSNVF